MQGVISHFAARHRVRHPGPPVVVSGDFNSPGPELRKWAATDSWAQPLDDLMTEEQPFNTYWAKAIDKQDSGYQGTSRIDHFLLKQGGGISAPAFTLYAGSNWAAMSNHRPLLCWITGPDFIPTDPVTQKPRRPPRRVRKHGLKQEDAKTVAKYVDKLKELNLADGLTNNGTPAQAAQTLLRLSKNGVRQSRRRKLQPCIGSICRLLVAYNGCLGCPPTHGARDSGTPAMTG